MQSFHTAACSQEVQLTLVFDLEIGRDQRRSLTSDPGGERLGGLRLVVFYYLDLKRGAGDEYITAVMTAGLHTSRWT